MGGLKNYITQLDGLLENVHANDAELRNAHRLIEEIKKVKTFKDLYTLIGFKYVIDQSGRLNQLESNSFDVVVSAAVLEHVHATIASEFVHGIAAVLKPGGYSIHTIGLEDHLYAYDSTVSVKQYLAYSNLIWKYCFESEVQYINRIQRANWLKLLENAGLVLGEEEVDTGDISGL
jgi:2-polyprenyl-3-methyl-5-hydroxy-6-metoxy-1,4-benzoquinol methylase